MDKNTLVLYKNIWLLISVHDEEKYLITVIIIMTAHSILDIKTNWKTFAWTEEMCGFLKRSFRKSTKTVRLRNSTELLENIQTQFFSYQLLDEIGFKKKNAFNCTGPNFLRCSSALKLTVISKAAAALSLIHTQPRQEPDPDLAPSLPL